MKDGEDPRWPELPEVGELAPAPDHDRARLERLAAEHRGLPWSG
ncbi:MAG TPA: hypothetical protein VJT31_16260 [Rugosimonospora sp.]|nr:hypothetical protein [Rugosimonospora sp.]